MANLTLSSIDFFLMIGLLFLSVVLVAFFSSSEASLISVNKFRVQHKSQSGDPSAQSVQRVIGQHEKFFATILLTENAFIILSSSVGTAIVIAILGGGWASILIATIIMTVLIVSLGEITPKSLAAESSDTWSLVVARPIEIIMKLETPLIFLFALLPRLISKLMGKGRQIAPSITEGELRMLIDIAQTEGMVQPVEAEMLENVFHFGDFQVHEIDTPRLDVVWVPAGLSLEEFLNLYAQYPYSRFPVYENGYDNVIGILSVKDVMRSIAKNELGDGQSVTHLARQPLFVPETQAVSELLKTFQFSKANMAIVIDEFGGADGIVTLTDLLEVVVGPLDDQEGMPDTQQISKVDEHVFDSKGNTTIDELNEQLGIHFPEGEYETIAGYILDELGHIPEEGEYLELEGFSMIISQVRGAKIELVRITQAPTTASVESHSV